MSTLKYLVTAILALSMFSYAYAACPADNTVISANTTYSSQVCAVDDAANNGVLQIGANSITLDCAGTVFVGSMRGIAIANPGYDNVTIKNCMIQDYNVGIWLNQAANSNKIMDNNITHSNFGIHILASTDTNIWDNNVDKNNMRGIYIARDSNRAWISDNNLSDNNRTGLETLASGDMNIFRNKISYGKTYAVGLSALYLDGGDFNVADNNIVGNWSEGILLNGFRNRVADNNVSNNRVYQISINTDTNVLRNMIDGSNQYGIRIPAGASRIIINGNTIRNTAVSAIQSNGATDVNISNNTVDRGNNIGLQGHASDVKWRIHDNNISGNTGNGITLAGIDINVRRNEISYNNIAIDISSGGSVSVLDNNIAGNIAYGIQISAAGTDLNISNNVIRANLIHGIFNGASSGTNVYITGNDINSNAVAGIYFDTFDFSPRILKNNIYSNGSGNPAEGGIYLAYLTVDFNVSDNNIWGNRPYGMYTDDGGTGFSGAVNFTDNNVQSNRYGFYSQTISGMSLNRNAFRKNMYAAYFGVASIDVNFFSNTVDGNNGYGIYFDSGITDLNIADSNISDNNTTGFFGWNGGADSGVDVNLWRTTIRNNAVWDINLNDTNILFVDGNYGSIRFEDAGAKVSRYWTVDLNIARSDTYAAVADANLWDINTQYNAALIGRTVAGSNGNFAQFTIKQFDRNFSSSAPYMYTPHKFRVTHDAYDSNTYTKTIDSNYDITIYLAPRGVSITSPQAGQVLSNPNVTFSYSASAGFSPVNKYWVKLDSQQLYTSNGTSASYTATLTSGAHTFYVVANGPQDVNSPVASVSFTINLGAGSAQCGDGVCGSGESASSCAADCPPVCGDNACTGTETPETCAADCVVGCGDNICDPDAGETCSTCASDCGTCAPGEEQLPAEETVLKQTQTAKATVQQIEDVLRDVGFTVSEIEAAKEAGTRLSIARTITVEKKAAEEGVPEEYESKITLAVTNTTASALKNVRIVEVIPKSVANTSDEATSARPFAVLKSDPVIQFSISEIPAGGTAEVKYSLAKKLTEEQIADYMPAVPAYAIEAAEATCANVRCDDKNPCTDDLCFDGECAYVYAKDGTTCGFGEECMRGVCRGVAFAGPAARALELNMFTIAIIAVVIGAVAVGIGVYIRRRC